mmetsp:Transcript_83633/g.221918  ORF Transcript_83633/g.221918 Transcript_83633/m.221918 type:complete len:311 (-) Transcript_83633:22-954(-)
MRHDALAIDEAQGPAAAPTVERGRVLEARLVRDAGPPVIVADDAVGGGHLGDADLSLEGHVRRCRLRPCLQIAKHGREVSQLAGVLVPRVVLILLPPLEGPWAARVRLLDLRAVPAGGVAAGVAARRRRIPVAARELGAAPQPRGEGRSVLHLPLVVDVVLEEGRGGVVGRPPTDARNQGRIDSQAVRRKENAKGKALERHGALDAVPEGGPERLATERRVQAHGLARGRLHVEPRVRSKPRGFAQRIDHLQARFGIRGAGVVEAALLVGPGGSHAGSKAKHQQHTHGCRHHTVRGKQGKGPRSSAGRPP